MKLALLLLALSLSSSACDDDSPAGADARLPDAAIADAASGADGDTPCTTSAECGPHGRCGDNGACGCEGTWQRVPGACEVPWWNVRYNQRKHITITNLAEQALPAKYTVELSLDHAALVAAGASMASGKDLRLVYFDGNTQGEIARRLPFEGAWNAPDTHLLFRTQDPLASGEASDGSYWLYYDAPTVTGDPNTSQLEVFDAEGGVPVDALDPSRDLLSARNDGGFYSIQFRRKETAPTDYEVYVRDRTYDPTAHASVLVRDVDGIVRVQTNYDSTIGDFTTPGIRTDGFIFIGVGAFSVYLEVSDSTSSQLYFGNSGVNFDTVGSGSETRYYYVRQRITPEPSVVL